MIRDDIDHERRKLFIGLTGAVGAVGAVGAAVPFVGSWMPSAKARAAGAPVTVDVGKLMPGQKMVVEWRGKPVWVIRRTPDMLNDLTKIVDELRDPNSEVETQQPKYAANKTRAIKEELLVLVGLCTHLGCSPLFKPEVDTAEFGKNWFGGFYCPCHGSKFDLAGRVYKGVPAPTNLEVPPYFYVTDEVITIGDDGSSTEEGVA